MDDLRTARRRGPVTRTSRHAVLLDVEDPLGVRKRIDRLLVGTLGPRKHPCRRHRHAHAGRSAFISGLLGDLVFALQDVPQNSIRDNLNGVVAATSNSLVPPGPVDKFPLAL